MLYMLSEDWDNVLLIQANPSFDLSALIAACGKTNAPPNGVVDHPPLDPPEFKPPYILPFGSPLSLVPSTEQSLLPLTPLNSSPLVVRRPGPSTEGSLSPLTPYSSLTSDFEQPGPTVKGLQVELWEQVQGKKRHRRGKGHSNKKAKNDDTDRPPSLSLSPLPSHSPSPLLFHFPSLLASNSASPLLSTPASPYSSCSSLPVLDDQQGCNCQTEKKHKAHQAKWRRLKESGTSFLSSKNMKTSSPMVTDFNAQQMNEQTDGYLGHPSCVTNGDRQVYPLSELIGPALKHKFRLQTIPSNAASIPIIDKNGTVIGILVRPP
ncbi:hypothetical protein VNI00_018136 [Paramarasmius palmivorus]|uniref:Uncharacterized protein n=1 Tax=Paramarasmius palmivorus TaxID=297713 RepID=A0AAW0B324_9AGAR